MYCTLLPAISFGSSAIVFFSGIPSYAAGPVADSVTPIFTCADAAVAAHTRLAASTASIHRFIFITCLQTLLEKSVNRPCDSRTPKHLKNLSMPHCSAYAGFPVKRPGQPTRRQVDSHAPAEADRRRSALLPG